jgi:hypothetical protein
MDLNASACRRIAVSVVAPIEPFVVSPMCGTRMSAPARAMSRAWPASNTYGAQVALVGQPDHVDLQVVPA